jgi:hypothetical protein
MDQKETQNKNQDGYFTAQELTEILNFIEREEDNEKAEVDIDKVAKAWSKVTRKQLYKN